MSQPAAVMAQKTIVIGLGNPILADDGVGIVTVERIAQQVEHPLVDFQWCSLAGFELLDLLVGYDKAIIVDSIKTGKYPVGQVMELEADSLMSTVRLASVHDINLATALELGRMLALPVPAEITIYVVEVADNTTFREGCCREVAAAVPLLEKAVINLLTERYEDLSVKGGVAHHA
ncbi:MAG: hydrogenase maturation protease [Clostridia bacterium]|jgi:hydrogenase maturation protease|nr:hydrogenase maturation protease [Clostridia bacterium]